MSDERITPWYEVTLAGEPGAGLDVGSAPAAYAVFLYVLTPGCYRRDARIPVLVASGVEGTGVVD